MAPAERPTSAAALRAPPSQLQNSHPTSPVGPRVRAAPHRAPSSVSSSLHPNVTTRSPNTLARKSRAESVASPDSSSSYHARGSHIGVRPTSSASNRSFASASINGNPSRLAQSSSMFYHANQTPTYAAPPTTYSVPAAAPKFFHADDAVSVADNQYRLARAPSRSLLSSPQLGAKAPTLAKAPILAPTSNPRQNYSPPSSRPGSTVGFSTSSRPSSMVGFPASPRPSSVVMGGPRTPTLAAVAPARGEVRFVYADGTEEVIPASKPTSVIGGSGTTSPLMPARRRVPGVSLKVLRRRVKHTW